MAKESKKVEGGPETPPPQVGTPVEGNPETQGVPPVQGIKPATGSPPVTVKASLPRRFRAGRAFGTEPVTISAGELTEEEFGLILSDPYLAVTEVGGRSTGT